MSDPSYQIRTYTRLSPLEVSALPVASLRDVKRGDCVVCFSRARLFEVKASVEALTGLTTAVVYGALPPAVRQAQARLFNGDRAEHISQVESDDQRHRADVLIATDAIGIGLNLRIRRIIFTQVGIVWPSGGFVLRSVNTPRQCSCPSLTALNSVNSQLARLSRLAVVQVDLGAIFPRAW